MNIPAAERLIVALDLPSAAEARSLVEALGDSVRFYKVGLELFSTEGYFPLVRWLADRGNKVFADLKLFDIPETVRRATANVSRSGASFLTVHAHSSVLRAAAAEKGAMKILGVTVLTSFDQSDLEEMGATKPLDELVEARARATLESGCDGVISSPHEAARLKQRFGSRLLVVTPGIRPASAAKGDQKRTMGVEEAFRAGADYIVVGRPIRDAADPRAAALALQASIAKALA
ncbi:MAG: orotidine-5'-phosphate decarboxylase [Betaproteobacteria bacterium]|nr:orotidine-5'-phosphate decarboxylase [Betaproteobacteria bacterium]